MLNSLFSYNLKAFLFLLLVGVLMLLNKNLRFAQIVQFEVLARLLGYSIFIPAHSSMTVEKLNACIQDVA